ncbi:MAG TPA: hypothetical protein VGP48_06735 [Stellaceae bacterium]|nr:hypothetical protein [Stellaceae bacterium]
MHIAVTVLGGVLLLAALLGFFRSLWRAPPNRERDDDSPDGLPPGALGNNPDTTGHHAQAGAHSGADTSGP